MTQRIGLTLGNGSARGLAHIGVLKALEEKNIKIDFIAGSSIGALIGAAYASGMSVERMEELALEIDLKKIAQLFISKPAFTGLINGKSIKNYILSHIGNPDFSQLKIPFVAAATDIDTGETVVLNKGSVVDAVRASISIPGIFAPVKMNNRLLIDGGVTLPLPIRLVKEMGGEKIIAVNVIPQPGKRKTSLNNSSSNNDFLGIKMVLKKGTNKLVSSWNLIGILMQSILILENTLIRTEIASQRPDVLIEPDVSSIKIFDFYRGKEVVDSGYKAAIKILNRR
ncbi:MAG: patatin-like phospholipase family protein [Deltaproteobacteria bacterium]|nr:patatin-like phospholipase family protein [Deltaproteobacteria bacterium]